MTHESSAATCLVCGSKRYRVFLRSEDQKIRSTRLPLRLVQCKNCDLVYLNPTPSPTFAERYFSEAFSGISDNAYFNDHSTKYERALARARWIKKPSRPAPRLLDVGCGSGQFVKAARSIGWNAIGIEPEPAAVEAAREQGNVSIRCDTIESVQLPTESFEAITMWDVIEHVPNPKVVIERSFELLAPGGKIVVRTGNIESLDYAWSGRRWDMIFSGHLSYFCPTTLTHLLRMAGFDDCEVHNHSDVDYSQPEPLKSKRPPTVSGGNAMKLLRNPKVIGGSLARYLRCRRVIRRAPESCRIPIMVMQARKTNAHTSPHTSR